MASSPASASYFIASSTPRAAYPRTITEATAQRAKGFLHGFLLPHALAFYAGVLGLSNDHDRLTAVAGYILAHKLEEITNRDVQRGDRTMRNLTKRETEVNLRATGCPRMGDESFRAAPDRSTSLDRQSGRASEVRRAGKGGSRAART